MSDGISSIKNIVPSYPVKPAQPANKDRESGRQQKDQTSTEPKSENENENENKPSIDEYI